MRRTAAALAAAFATVALAGPLAAASLAGPSALQCAGTASGPACARLDDVAAALTPLQPVLNLAGPTMAALTPAMSGLAVRADGPGGVPVSEVSSTADALLEELAVLPTPVRQLLAPAPLDSLTEALEFLVAELAPAAAPEPSGSAGGSPTPAAPPTPARATSSGAPTPSGELGGAFPASSSGPAVPEVPVGDPLILAPLAVADFDLGTSFGLAPAAEVAPSSTTGAEAAEVRLAAERAADLLNGGGGSDLGVVLALSLLLLGAAFVAHARQERHAIPGD